MSTKVVVFDFDGTIADTLEAARKILNEMSVVYGFKSIAADEVEMMRHYTLKKLIKHLGISKLQVPKLLHQGLKELKSRIDTLKLIDGMQEAVEAIAASEQYELGILTSNSRDNVEDFLKRHGMIEKFHFISSTSKLTGKHKYMRSICKTFSMDPSHMLYVGDEIRDVKAAKKAGVPIVAVGWGFNSKDALAEFEPEHMVDTPAQLVELLNGTCNS